MAEVSVTGGKLKVHRVVCAVDCGRVVNPAILEQQIQSGIVFGLAAALKGGITIDRGRVQQSNFHQYDVLRIDEMPVVEVHIVTSQNAVRRHRRGQHSGHRARRLQCHLQSHRQAHPPPAHSQGRPGVA